jgi:hypothetical protein
MIVFTSVFILQKCHTGRISSRAEICDCTNFPRLRCEHGQSGKTIGLAMIRVVVLLAIGVTLASCASGGVVGEVLPTWAGGMPKNVPPRPGTPEYEAHKERLEGRSKIDAEQKEEKKPETTH